MSFSFSFTETTNAPIVALHSSASNGSQWQRLAEDLKDRFSVHALDLPGYGRNPVEGDMTQTGAAVAAVPVIREIEALERPVHLVGHSNGGGIALKVALLRPDLVKSLTVYEPAAFHFLKHGDDRSQGLFNQINRLSDMVTAAVRDGNPAAGMRHFLDFWNEGGFWSSLPSAVQNRFTGQISSVMTDFANGFAETWDLKDLSGLRMPSLVMTGLDSPEIAQQTSLSIAKALPSARVALLPELGHMAPVFQPDWVNSRIIEHVTNSERPAVNISWPDQKAA